MTLLRKTHRHAPRCDRHDVLDHFRWFPRASVVPLLSWCEVVLTSTELFSIALAVLTRLENRRNRAHVARTLGDKSHRICGRNMRWRRSTARWSQHSDPCGRLPKGSADSCHLDPLPAKVNDSTRITPVTRISRLTGTVKLF